ncbi:MAG: hypothetical protein ABI980_10830 [Nitrospirota bacterium]
MLQPENRNLALDLAIIEELARGGTCTFDQLTERLHCYSWNEVFSEVDLLSRKGAITLQRSLSLDYMISLGPH